VQVRCAGEVGICGGMAQTYVGCAKRSDDEVWANVQVLGRCVQLSTSGTTIICRDAGHLHHSAIQLVKTA
jgi:hypothetical protein